jgi:hypothetical protein
MSIDDLEQQLRSSLNRHASGQSGPGADLADVFGRARRIRRRRTALVASAAAVAVLAVAVPAGVLVASRDTSAPPPPVSTVTPSTPATETTRSTESPTPTPPTSASATSASGAGLAGIAMGAPTTLTYLDPAGVMHNGSELPGGDYDDSGAPVSAFTPYHGGWLVAYDDFTLTQYAADGHSVANHPRSAPATITVSDDGMRTAWQIGQEVYAGISSGMGEGETSWQIGPTEGLVGYLGAGPVVSGGQGYTILTGPHARSTVDSAITPNTVSQAADAVGGVVGTVAAGDQQGALADAKTGAVYWKGSWAPLSFSTDGKYVAAIPAVDNGDASEIAILDARTGTLIARTAGLTDQLHLTGQLAWDGDRVIFSAEGNPDFHRLALFALDTHGRVAQVSPTATDPVRASFGFVFMRR